jgi:glutathione reductase (NADPH)
MPGRTLHCISKFFGQGGSMDFDLIVIGGGTAGLSAMKTAHALGAKIAIVEEEDFAGTCLRTG